MLNHRRHAARDRIVDKEVAKLELRNARLREPPRLDADDGWAQRRTTPALAPGKPR